MKKTLPLLIILFSLFACGDKYNKLEKKWHFKAIQKNDRDLLEILPNQDFFHLKNDGSFHYELAAKNNLVAKGSYHVDHDYLVLEYNQPKDTVRRYHITELKDNSLIITENEVNYIFN